MKYKRSSNQFRLLLLCVLTFSFSSLQAFSTDTLIVDGKKVIINRVIEYDTVSVNNTREPSEIKRPKQGIPWLLGVEGGAFATSTILESDLNNLRTVDDMIGRELRFDVNPGALFYGGLILSDQWSVMVGLGAKNITATYSHFNTDQLDDSLYRFESFEDGELSQITRYDFGELGAELDTLSISLSEREIELRYLEVPLLFNFSPSLPKSRLWKLDFQFGLQAQFLYSTSTSDLILLNKEADLETVPESGQRFTKTLFGVQAAGGVNRKLASNFYGYARIHLQLPLNSPTDPVSRVQLNFYQAGLQLGLRYQFEP
ncbi:hypothetical protein [Halocola ammonii]